jgi:hypothetical protein
VKRFECIVTSAEAELRGRIVGDFDKTGRLIWLGLCPEQAVQTPVACLKWVEYLPTFDILMRSDSLSFSAIKLNSPIRVPILFLAPLTVRAHRWEGMALSVVAPPLAAL